MSTLPNITYTVVLVFPGFGGERENAEQLVEEALYYLNTQKDEPGMRFAPQVAARLEMVRDADEAQAVLATDDDLALMILHDLPPEEQAALTEACAAQGVLVCHTVDASDKPRPARAKQRRWKVVFRQRTAEGPRAHQILATTLTAPLEGDPEELADRVGQLITVLALSVMERHWTRHPPAYYTPE